MTKRGLGGGGGGDGGGIDFWLRECAQVYLWHAIGPSVQNVGYCGQCCRAVDVVVTLDRVFPTCLSCALCLLKNLGGKKKSAWLRAGHGRREVSYSEFTSSKLWLLSL